MLPDQGTVRMPERQESNVGFWRPSERQGAVLAAELAGLAGSAVAAAPGAPPALAAGAAGDRIRGPAGLVPGRRALLGPRELHREQLEAARPRGEPVRVLRAAPDHDAGPERDG